MQSIQLHWLTPAVLLSSDRLLDNVIGSPIQSAIKESTQKNLYRMALKDYQSYLPGRLRQEDIDLALGQWIDISKPLDLSSIITTFRKSFISWRGDRFEVENQQLELWLSLLSQIDPAWIIGSGYAELVDNETLSINQVIEIVREQCPNALPKRFDGEPVADNHVHLGGHGHYSLSMAAFALHLNKRPSNDRSKWPFRQEHTFFNSQMREITDLPVLLHRLFGFIINGINTEGIDHKSVTYDWDSLSTHQITRHATELNSIPLSGHVHCLLASAVNESGPASWVLITTAIMLLLRQTSNIHKKKYLTAFIMTSSVLRNYMVVSGVGLGDFVQYFKFGYRKPIAGINYRKQSQLYDLTEHYLREFRVGDSDYKFFYELARFYLEHNVESKMHFVFHFTRGFNKGEKNRRYSLTRRNSKATVRNLQSFISSLTFSDFPIVNRNSLEYKQVDLRAMLRGFDVAGNENEIPIEVFSPALRVLRSAIHKYKFPLEKRLRQPFITLHAGEDFSHILSGLRAIDEAVSFCDYKPGDRIGHGLALGIDVQTWIARQQHIYLPLQEHLDNLVWCYHMGLELVASHPQFQSALMIVGEKIRHFCCELHEQEISPRALYQAWQLRRNCPEASEQQAEALGSEWLLWVPDADCIRRFQSKDSSGSNQSPYHLWQKYLNRKRHDKDHDKVVSISYSKNSTACNMNPKFGVIEDTLSNAELDLIHGIQDLMLERFSQSQWILEACPTSNLYIGRLEHYNEHPIFRWFPLNREDLLFGGRANRFGIRKGAVRVCINTDDAGLMPTTLENEHRVIKECAMKNASVSDYDAHQWIESIRKTGVELFHSNHLNWLHEK
ncbi:hypothetical protein A6E05_12340 [Aliivibrio sp. 1S165]|uniref:antiviral RADAR system adenosine deaminase RdrB n=1 Tax=unclassified Aliivibrio TaxID=2645654 RepID=UPI00080E1803|nr:MULTISPECIES: antiviral RADAR system adenosine deaminase RdrB [unclassified Aliivibrio]OCH18118.1 hypothetical protein A6E05_12340 [Aliivibrio sp. 1S165]OCH35495.1 hypothetical protein A6E06_13080 [Aliivibrio sp. 1S175]USN27187.1 hypothetical protein [synthetic construct]